MNLCDFSSPQIASKENLHQVSSGCSLGDMLTYDDTDRDGRLDINEFYVAFSKLYSKHAALATASDNTVDCRRR